MGRAPREPAGQAVGDLHQQVARPRGHQNRTEDDEYEHVAGDDLQRLAEHAAGLRPEIQHHRPEILAEAGFRSGEYPRPVGQVPPDEEIDDPEDAERDDEAAEIPPGQVEGEGGRNRKQHEVDGRGGRKQARIDREQRRGPRGEGNKRDAGEQRVDPAPTGGGRQGQEVDHERKQDGEAEYQSGRQQESPLEGAEARSQPVVLEKQALVAPGQLLKVRNGDLDQPANQFVERSGGCIGQDHDREQRRQRIGHAPFPGLCLFLHPFLPGEAVGTVNAAVDGAPEYPCPQGNARINGTASRPHRARPDAQRCH